MNKLLIATCLITLLSCNQEKKEAATEEKKEIKSENVQLSSDTDPVCQMSVKNHYEDTAVYEGKVYGFCNVACKDEFKKNPENYLKK